ncbi:MAG TPA: hypothetical protein VF020_18050 [Chthoniobacterales bacterium]
MSALILIPMIGRADDDDSPGQKAKDVIKGIGQGVREAIHDRKESPAIDVSLGRTHLDMPTNVDAGEITFKVTNIGTDQRAFKISGPGLERYFTQPLPPGESQRMTVYLDPGVYKVEAPAVGVATNDLTVQITAVAREND